LIDYLAFKEYYFCELRIELIVCYKFHLHGWVSEREEGVNNVIKGHEWHLRSYPFLSSLTARIEYSMCIKEGLYDLRIKENDKKNKLTK